MSVGNNAPKSAPETMSSAPLPLMRTARQPPQQQDTAVRPHPGPQPVGFRTSFKTMKPKPSKVKYLTAKELVGIGLSIALSFALSLTAMYVVITASPIVYTYLLEVGDVISGQDSSVVTSKPKSSRIKLSRFLTPSDLNCSSFSGSEPALISGQSRVQIEGLLKKYGHVTVDLQPLERLGRHRSTAKSYGDAAGDVRATLAELRGHYPLSDLGGNFYALDGTDGKALAVMGITKLPAPPTGACSPFKDFRAVSLAVGRNSSALSGSDFHIHRQSVSELLVGRKHWVLYPPSQVPASGFSSYENMAQWYETVYPTLPPSKHSVEIIQEAGQLVYVPEGWYHATRTLATSVTSVSVRWESPQEAPGGFYHYLVAGDGKFKGGDYKAAIKLYRVGLALQKDRTLLAHLGQALELQGHYQEAEEVYKELIEASPREPLNYAVLVNIFVAYASRDVSNSVHELLQKADKHGLRETVLGLTKTLL